MTTAIQLKKIANFSPACYKISRELPNLVSISNLTPNTIHSLGFNDLRIDFLSNAKGFIYLNARHDPLPVDCIPFPNMNICPNIMQPLLSIKPPIGNYAPGPRKMNHVECKGKKPGCYQKQASGNLVPARTDTAPRYGWTKKTCGDPHMLASGVWCSCSPIYMTFDTVDYHKKHTKTDILIQGGNIGITVVEKYKSFTHGGVGVL